MSWAGRLADETAHHYAELRERRVPLLPAILMAIVFHHALARAVLYDDQFEKVIGKMLEPATKEVG